MTATRDRPAAVATPLAVASRVRSALPGRAVQRRLGLTAVLAGVLLVHGVQPALADPGGNALGETIVWALKETLRTLFSPIRAVIERYGNTVLQTVVHTPRPNAVFEPPTNGAWPAVYDYYWTAILPLSLFLYGLSIGVVILLESTSHLFSTYHRSKLKKRAFSGLLGIMLWWWLAAISLRLTDAVTRFLLPDLSTLTLFQTLSFGAMGVLGLVVTLATDFVLFILIALIYLLRQFALYLFVLLMPILIALWVPGVGPLALVSRFVKRLAGFYVPFLFMVVPVAGLFRVGELLGEGVSVSMGGIGAWIAGLIVPAVAVVAPFVFFWQASALFFVADRASHRVSRRRARERVGGMYDRGRRTVRGGRNFVRGARGQAALDSDGGSLLDFDRPRAYAGGTRVRRTGARLRRTLSRDGHRDEASSGQRSARDRHDRQAAPTDRDDDGRGDRSNDDAAGDSTDDHDDHPRYLH